VITASDVRRSDLGGSDIGSGKDWMDDNGTPPDLPTVNVAH